MPSRVRLIFPFFSVLLLFTVSLAFSKWVHNGTMIVEGVFGQKPARIAADDSGGAIMVWKDFRNTYWDIYAQKIDAQGNLLWNEGGIGVCTAKGDQHMIEVVSDRAGGAIIAWLDLRRGWDIYAQRIGGDGVPLWQDQGSPICTAPQDRSCLTLVSDGAGGAVAAWVDKRSRKWQIYVQRIDNNGDSLWEPDGISLCPFSDHQWVPVIAVDSCGVTITWQDNRGANWDVYAQRLNLAGVTQWDERGVPVCTTELKQFSPQITSSGNCAAIIAWYDVAKDNMDIYAQKIDANGQIEWMRNGIAICTAVGNQRKPRLAPDGSGGAVITWSDDRVGHRDIYAQAINSNGLVKWRADGVAVCTADDEQWYAQIIPDDLGGAIITWQGLVGNFRDVYAGRIDKNGNVVWGERGAEICNELDHQFLPQIAPNGKGGAIITWLDMRKGDYTADLFVQMIDSNGQTAARVDSED